MYGYQSSQKKIAIYTTFIEDGQQDRVYNILFYVFKLEWMDHKLGISFFLSTDHKRSLG